MRQIQLWHTVTQASYEKKLEEQEKLCERVTTGSYLSVLKWKLHALKRKKLERSLLLYNVWNTLVKPRIVI